MSERVDSTLFLACGGTSRLQTSASWLQTSAGSSSKPAGLQAGLACWVRKPAVCNKGLLSLLPPNTTQTWICMRTSALGFVFFFLNLFSGVGVGQGHGTGGNTLYNVHCTLYIVHCTVYIASYFLLHTSFLRCLRPQAMTRISNTLDR